MKKYFLIVALFSLIGHAVAQVYADKDASPAASPSPGKHASIETDLSPCRTWAWQYNSMLVTLHPDGTVSKNLKLADAHWEWVDEPKRKLRINWGNWLDQATLASDHQSMRVKNNAGDTYTVHLLTAEPKESGSLFVSPATETSSTNQGTEPTPCGDWIWHGGSSIVTINPDGTVNQGDKEIKGIWHWLDGRRPKVRIDWISGWVDDATVSKDNMQMDVLNNAGGMFTVIRAEKKAAAEASPTP